MSELFLNVRRPSPEAARLSRNLLMAGMTPLQQARWTNGNGTGADLKALADSLTVVCTIELADHAVAEWRACYAAVPQELKERVNADIALARQRGEIDW